MQHFLLKASTIGEDVLKKIKFNGEQNYFHALPDYTLKG
jgi:hypothetical protein